MVVQQILTFLNRICLTDVFERIIKFVRGSPLYVCMCVCSVYILYIKCINYMSRTCSATGPEVSIQKARTRVLAFIHSSVSPITTEQILLL